ncbi:MAG: PD-(D/E)XK nuclease family protein [Deltaproteobacteria bacterium]|nr:PD-(D/E)XK nuclease family protein [Deltaproteobacteria bacterium]
MNMKSPAPDELIARLKGGGAVVTVNRRLARSLHSSYDARLRASGALAWPTPAIMPLSAWLESLWAGAWQGGSLMDSARSLALWERIIASDKALPDVLAGNRSLARFAADAYSIIHEYGLRASLVQSGPFLTEEATAFRRWLGSYEDAVARVNWVDPASLSARVAALIESGKCVLPHSVIFAGFDEFTPAQRRLVEALRSSGIDVDAGGYAASAPAGAVTVRPYVDEREEVEQAGRWIRRMARPGARIGLICPELGVYRDLIKREFDAELYPASVLPDAGGEPGYNISLGLPLSSEPLVRSGLDILAIGPGAASLDALSAAFMSPYFATGAGHTLIAGVDAVLRRDNRTSASLAEYRRRLGSDTGLASRLGRWLDRLNNAPRKAGYAWWTGAFDALLGDMGWLCDVKLSSNEYQALSAWHRLLYTFASLDGVGQSGVPDKGGRGGLTAQEAVARLAALASETIHQPETPQADIEVLGLLEATGLEFDALWLMGCHEGALPASPSPNPFIPLEAQRAAGVPHSSHERELAFAARALNRVLRAAPSIVVSYPRRIDEREMRPSPFFATDAALAAPFDMVKSSARLRDAVFQRADFLDHDHDLEKVPDEPAIPVTEAERPYIKGGTAILKDQSLCPFKAFATYRLRACGIAVPEPGLSPRDKGSLLHAAMRGFWDKVVDSERLRELSAGGSLPGFAASMTEEIFAEVRLSSGISPRLIELEKERIRALLLDWADKELARGAFKVKAVELKTELNIAGLPITCRLDRVDEISGGEVIIDYKTGAVKSPADFFRKRPADPQLQVYSLTGAYDAVSFAKVVPGDCRFVGVSKAEETLPGVRPPGVRYWEGDWAALMEFWKATVEGLAAAFMAGEASVDPNPELKGMEAPCAHCDLTVLCRITETGNVNMAEEDTRTDD